MTARMSGAKHLLQLFTPPALWSVGQALRRRFDSSVDHLEYAPAGWNTLLPAGNTETFWNAFIAQERDAYEALVARLETGDANSAAQPDEHLKHIVFGSVLGQVVSGRQKVSLLDYGGNFGDYACIAHAWLPEVTVDFHCKELPAVAQAGRTVNPSVTWHTNESCFDIVYDMVMFVSSVQYLPAWQDTLRRAVVAASDALLLLDVAAVRGVPSFVATQRSRGMLTLYNVLNRDEVVAHVERNGLRLVREFDMGPHPPVAKAPRQPGCLGLLFRR